jgi:alpha-methylacyl-CoA racemase
MLVGPLEGLRFIEFAGLGPAPHAAMLLSDLGADVIRIDRVSAGGQEPGVDNRHAFILRGRQSVALDLKRPSAVEVALRLIEQADGLIEGFRPGVMERLGLGPDACLRRNPRLVYGRMTGWGQDGPLAHTAGHDINYIAVTGALHALGDADRPPAPPLNLVGDFGGGSMFLVMGLLAGIIEAGKSGRGQVVDCAMVDGTVALMANIWGFLAQGQWKDQRQSNRMDGAAHFYRCYETLDGKFLSVGSIEPQFYEQMLTLAGIDAADLPAQWDRDSWPEASRRLEAIFRTRTRDEWMRQFAGTDACVAPVLNLREAAEHPHLRARASIVGPPGAQQPAPAPRFSRTVAEIARPPAQPGEHTEEVLRRFGLDDAAIAALRSDRAIA